MRRMMRGAVLVLAAGLMGGGCRLHELLYPGPPPQEPVCYQTVTMRWVNADGDTTVTKHTRTVECPPEEEG